VIASSITGGLNTVADTVPYVWSDQFDIRLQVAGRSLPGDDIRVFEHDGALACAIWSRDGLVTPVLAINAPKVIVRARRAIRAGTSATDFIRQNDLG